MVTVSVLALMVAAAAPAVASYVTNARVREAANQTVAFALAARSEALKRNGSVRLTSGAGALQMFQVRNGVPTLIRTVELPAGSTIEPFEANYDSAGRLAPFGTEVLVRVSSATAVCSEDVRCPAVRLEAGGSVLLCATGECL